MATGGVEGHVFKGVAQQMGGQFRDRKTPQSGGPEAEVAGEARLTECSIY